MPTHYMVQLGAIHLKIAEEGSDRKSRGRRCGLEGNDEGNSKTSKRWLPNRAVKLVVDQRTDLLATEGKVMSESLYSNAWLFCPGDCHNLGVGMVEVGEFCGSVECLVVANPSWTQPISVFCLHFMRIRAEEKLVLAMVTFGTWPLEETTTCFLEIALLPSAFLSPVFILWLRGTGKSHFSNPESYGPNFSLSKAAGLTQPSPKDSTGCNSLSQKVQKLIQPWPLLD
ncbi:hypothetical protein FKP32DRAFT_1602874 [Trametes sanguinea]|nr:hypothetical protein FKP32DRAFT_1602874 [Trametes sanguinea]